MSASAPVIAARLLRGTAVPEQLFFSSGTPVHMFSIGRHGSWRLEVQSVKPIHAFIYFDGRHCWVFNAQPDAPVHLDGHLLGDAWMQVVAPAVLSLGEAQVAFEAIEAGGDESAMTRAVDPELVRQYGLAIQSAGADAPEPPAGYHSPSKRDATSSKHMRLPRVRFTVGRLIAASAVVVSLALVSMRGLKRTPTGRLRAADRRAVPSASAASSKPPPMSSALAAASPTSSVSAPRAQGEPGADEDPGDSEDDSTDQDEPISAERQAVDALAAGDMAVAFECYLELSKKHPERQVFRQATIMTERKLRLSHP